MYLVITHATDQLEVTHTSSSFLSSSLGSILLPSLEVEMARLEGGLTELSYEGIMVGPARSSDRLVTLADLLRTQGSPMATLLFSRSESQPSKTKQTNTVTRLFLPGDLPKSSCNVAIIAESPPLWGSWWITLIHTHTEIIIVHVHFFYLKKTKKHNNYLSLKSSKKVASLRIEGWSTEMWNIVKQQDSLLFHPNRSFSKPERERGNKVAFKLEGKWARSTAVKNNWSKSSRMLKTHAMRQDLLLSVQQ